MSGSKNTLTVPGPPSTPLLGSMGNLLQLTRDPLKYMDRLFKSFGSIAALVGDGPSRVFSTQPDCPGTIFVYGPELSREVEVQHDVYHKSPLSGTLYPKNNPSPRQEPLLEYVTGLFSVNGNEHRRHRRLLAPAFHKKRIEAYCADMVNLTQEKLDEWKIGESRNIHAEMMHLSQRIATKTLFGAELGEGKSIGAGLQKSLRLIRSPWTILFPYDLPGLPYRRFLDVVKQINVGIRDIVAQRRAQASYGSDVLSMLLQTRDEDDSSLSESEVIGHTTVIFAAGHETSSNALTWTLFLLSQHPRVAADLLDELESVLNGCPPTLDQLNKLPLLDYTIKESMRVLPPGPWNTRITSQPTVLGAHDIPIGTEVIVSIYHTHRIPELYEQPEVFNPYRWATLERDAFEYNPFGAGPRMCLGAAFAMQEMKIVLAMLLQRYRLQFIPGTTVNRFVSITMSPKNGLPMIVQEQDRQFGQGIGGVRGNVNEMIRWTN